MSDICTAVLVYFLKVTIFVMQVSKVKTKLNQEVGGLCQAQTSRMKSLQKDTRNGPGRLQSLHQFKTSFVQ